MHSKSTAVNHGMDECPLPRSNEYRNQSIQLTACEKKKSTLPRFASQEIFVLGEITCNKKWSKFNKESIFDQFLHAKELILKYTPRQEN